MPAMICPHNCGISFDEVQALNVTKVRTMPGGWWEAQVWVCPGCDGLTLDLVLVRQVGHGVLNDVMSKHGYPTGHSAAERHRAWPRSSRTAAPEVPPDLARDYQEAASVLDVSPRAAAALTRRALQDVLRNHLGATGSTLEKQIDSVGSTVPSFIGDGLHQLRHLGNFAAHPIKDQLSGDLIDVEPGEAEWGLEVLGLLFDFAFVQPARAAAQKAALNVKLQAAGKPTI